MDRLSGKEFEVSSTKNIGREDSSQSDQRYFGRNEEESLIIDFARKGIFDPEIPFSLYLWEAKAILDGATLKNIDERRNNLELAAFNAGITNAKKPRTTIKKMQRELEKEEEQVVQNKKGRKKPNVEALKRINDLFNHGGE